MLNNLNQSSENLDNTLNSQFEKKINTTEGYKKVVDSFNALKEDVHPEFIEQLEKYKEGLLSLCSDHMSVTNNPEVQSIIASCHNEFMHTYGKTGDETRKREFRSLLMKSSNNLESGNNPYFGKDSEAA